jgi:hypothetical protein
MNPLDQVKLSIPPIWEKQEEWAAAVEEVEAEEKGIVRVQSELARILRHADQREPQPELLAWLILWTRAFQSLDGLRGAVLRRSLLTCRVIERTLFETALHLMVIAQRPSSAGAQRGSSFDEESARLGLRSYLAWCLWNDAEEWRDFLRPEHLRELYDPGPARQYVREHGEAIQHLSHLFADVETLTDAEAEVERAEAEEAARKRLNLLDRWLSDSRLQHAVDRLRGNRSDSRRKPKRIWSFLELMNENEASVRKALEAQGSGYGYSIFSRTSSAVHGSSVESILWTNLPAVGPQIWASDADLRERVHAALTWGQSCTLALYLLRPRNGA